MRTPDVIRFRRYLPDGTPLDPASSNLYVAASGTYLDTPLKQVLWTLLAGLWLLGRLSWWLPSAWPLLLFNLAFLLAVSGDSGAARTWLRALWILPLGWCGLSAVTLATMGSPQAWVILAAALLAAATVWLRR